ncbi:tetratricopeptide repeat protein [Providencia rettgeri]|uniref:tetratricopeptide repeat protein n=1 Tax=Providencia rettgeri TaxID=587 RepID=UPI0023AA2EF0|nr:tetratricopeptide repeat protein [Providencia rettgeri]
MKIVALLLLGLSVASTADICDDLYVKNHLDWASKDNLAICREALEGDADAQFDLAGWYKLHENNAAEALNWALKSAAQGCAKSEYVAGLMLYDGQGTEMDWFRAFHLIESAAKKGLPQARTTLGFMYLNGHAVGMNKITAKKLIEKSVQQNDPAAYELLGEMYQKGDGVPINENKAAQYRVLKLIALIKTGLSENYYFCDKNKNEGSFSK